MIERRTASSGRGYEYQLTDAGRELEPLIRWHIYYGLDALVEGFIRHTTLNSAARKLMRAKAELKGLQAEVSA